MAVANKQVDVATNNTENMTPPRDDQSRGRGEDQGDLDSRR